jgi:hypothetical protein
MPSRTPCWRPLLQITTKCIKMPLIRIFKRLSVMKRFPMSRIFLQWDHAWCCFRGFGTDSHLWLFKISKRAEWLVSFTPGETATDTYCIGSWLDSRARLVLIENSKISCRPPEIERQLPFCLARSLVAVPTELSCLPKSTANIRLQLLYPVHKLERRGFADGQFYTVTFYSELQKPKSLSKRDFCTEFQFFLHVYLKREPLSTALLLFKSAIQRLLR